MNADTLDFLGAVVVDHIDGVVAEDLIARNFAPAQPAPLPAEPDALALLPLEAAE